MAVVQYNVELVVNGRNEVFRMQFNKVLFRKLKLRTVIGIGRLRTKCKNRKPARLSRSGTKAQVMPALR